MTNEPSPGESNPSSHDLVREILSLTTSDLSGELFETPTEHLAHLECIVTSLLNVPVDQLYKRSANTSIKIILLQSLLLRAQGKKWDEVYIIISTVLPSDDDIERDEEFVLARHSLESYYTNYITDSVKRTLQKTRAPILNDRLRPEYLSDITGKRLRELMARCNMQCIDEFFSKKGLARLRSSNDGFLSIDNFVWGLYERYILQKDTFSQELTDTVLSDKSIVTPLHNLFNVKVCLFLTSRARTRLRYLRYQTPTARNAHEFIALALLSRYSRSDIATALQRNGVECSDELLYKEVWRIGNLALKKLPDSDKRKISDAHITPTLVAYIAHATGLPISGVIKTLNKASATP